MVSIVAGSAIAGPKHEADAALIRLEADYMAADDAADRAELEADRLFEVFAEVRGPMPAALHPEGHDWAIFGEKRSPDYYLDRALTRAAANRLRGKPGIAAELDRHRCEALLAAQTQWQASVRRAGKRTGYRAALDLVEELSAVRDRLAVEIMNAPANGPRGLAIKARLAQRFCRLPGADNCVAQWLQALCTDALALGSV